MYRISLDVFQGPLDLLLFFIRRDELDVYDIPIARITDEYLQYVRALQQVDLDNVGDFIYMAALLLSIKARMLLPRDEADDTGETLDPRQELVERLLEYVRFKEAGEQMDVMHDERARLYPRGEAADRSVLREPKETPTVDGSVVDLVSALGRFLVEAEDVVHEVVRVDVRVEDQVDFLREHLTRGHRVLFGSVVHGKGKPYIIATFLAVLELARQREVWITMVEDGLDFELERVPDEVRPDKEEVS